MRVIGKDNTVYPITLNPIPKKDLVDEGYYFGVCRNASIARWNADEQKFTYFRIKFGNGFTEDINHYEDDNGFDLFVPYYRIDVYGVERI